MKLIVALAAGVALAAIPAVAQQAQAPAATAAPVAETPEDFVAMAASSNAFEIQSSELALERSETEAVQAFAQVMIDDHTAATEDLMTVAEAEGVTPPPMELDPRHQGMLDELQAAEGDAFDELYTTMQLQAHEEAIALHSNFAEEGDAGALGEFAAEKLPVIEDHREMIEGIGGN